MSDLPPPPTPPSMPPPPPPNMSPPPGYVAYGGPGAVYGQFSRIRALSKWLVVLLAIGLAAQAASLVVQFALRNSAKDYLNDIATSKFTDRLGLYVAVGALVALASVAQLVILIIWTYRMAKNLQVLGRMPQSFGPGATVAINILGGCTLGILNFFMWRELWRGSDPDTAAGDPSWKQRPVTSLIPLHLALGLAGTVAGIAGGIAAGFNGVRVSGNSDKDLAKQFSDRIASVTVSGLLSIAAAVVFIMIVRQLSARHMAATREP